MYKNIFRILGLEHGFEAECLLSRKPQSTILNQVQHPISVICLHELSREFVSHS